MALVHRQQHRFYGGRMFATTVLGFVVFCQHVGRCCVELVDQATGLVLIRHCRRVFAVSDSKCIVRVSFGLPRASGSVPVAVSIPLEVLVPPSSGLSAYTEFDSGWAVTLSEATAESCPRVAGAVSHGYAEFE